MIRNRCRYTCCKYLGSPVVARLDYLIQASWYNTWAHAFGGVLKVSNCYFHFPCQYPFLPIQTILQKKTNCSLDKLATSWQLLGNAPPTIFLSVARCCQPFTRTVPSIPRVNATRWEGSPDLFLMLLIRWDIKLWISFIDRRTICVPHWDALIRRMWRGDTKERLADTKLSAVMFCPKRANMKLTNLFP